MPTRFAGGILLKGLVSNTRGQYIQTSITDTDPAMIYKPALANNEAKAHFAATDIAQAQKVAVRFIAEEAIDSTLNSGYLNNKDIDSWLATHKDQILPAAQQMIVSDLKSRRSPLAQELWMAADGKDYAYGPDAVRVANRTITPTAIRYVANPSNGLQGLMVDTKLGYSMKMSSGGRNSTTGTVSYAVAKVSDGTWKIAGWSTQFHTAG